MDKFTFNINNKQLDFCINGIKFILGKNYLMKYKILNVLRQRFLKVPKSEYAEENNNGDTVYFNDNSLDIKNWIYYEITPNFDVLNDFKLGTKSLCLKYLEVCLEGIEYDDSLNTVNIMLKDLCENIISELISFGDLAFEVDPLIEPIDAKNILKMINFSLSIDNLAGNQYDLSYQETIALQLMLLKKIAEKKDKKVIATFDMPYVDDSLLKLFNKFVDIDNVFLIISYNGYFDCGLERILFIDKKGIDLANDNSIYEDILLNLSFVVDIDALKMMLLDIVNGKETEKLMEIRNYL